jgi:hypothetical protein
MAAFPTIYPGSVSLAAGKMNTERIVTQSGTLSVFRRGLGKRDVIFNLTYTNLQSADINLIRQHFLDHYDMNVSFTVPREILSGTGVVSTTAEFYYDAAIEETQKGLFSDLTVALRAFDSENVIINIDGGTSAARTEATITKNKADLSTYLFSGTDPFLLDGDDAAPAIAASVILEGGRATQ